MMSKLCLYYHTLKHLKCKQLFFRLWYKFYRPKISLNIGGLHAREVQKDAEFLTRNQSYFMDGMATFLNHSVDISSGNIWNDKTQEKLWLYNLHYFDALSAVDVKQREIAYDLLQRWLKENPFAKKGNAWEPYAVSLRIVNIIKYVLSGNTLDAEVKNSLYIQARFLNKICEYHLLGNHLFENFKALCFAGLFFEGVEANKWFKKGLQGLKKEIKEQILEDGGHFELSPMYHCIILEDLLELEQVFTVYARDDEFPWKQKIEKMLVWLFYMMRNQNSISYFNDAADGIAHTPREIFAYAKLLGYRFESVNSENGVSVDSEDRGQKTEDSTQHPILNPQHSTPNSVRYSVLGVENNTPHRAQNTHTENSHSFLKDSGYIVVKNGHMKAIIDVARIGPDYLPGHAHADTLSFELMIDDQPVFVNLGTSCYGSSARREFERSTKAHNTLAINGENSSEMWSSFRVARRARARLISIEQKEVSCTVAAEHNGYKRLSKPIIHRRVWQFAENGLSVSDILAWANNSPKRVSVSNQCHTHTDNSHSVAGGNVVTTELRSAKAYLHLHPDCQIVSQQNRSTLIALPNGKKLEVQFCDEYEIQDSQYAVSFGQLSKTKSICYLGSSKNTTVLIKWQ